MEPKAREFTPDELVAITSQQAKMEGRKLDAVRIAQEMRLRQWCVEQAVKTIDNMQLPPPRPGGGSTININLDVCSIARNILDFVYEPLTEKKEAP